MADFRILQDNARKFSFNRNAQQRKKTALQDAGAFRAPTENTRSFEPQFGDVQVLGNETGAQVMDQIRSGTQAKASTY